MTKHRSVVTGWDPDHVNPDDSTGRPKGVQTAADMRIATTYDILAEGIFAKYGVPTITGSPTDTATISPFQAAIASSLGGFYVITVDANEQITINLSNVGAVKIYAQQQDYETDNTKVDSNVVIGVVYGATAIPAGSILLFTTTITSQTSTSGLTFTPAFKWTGAASGQIRVPAYADLANVTVLQAGIRALVMTGAQAGEYFYGSDSAWHLSSVANAKLDGFLNDYVDSSGDLKPNMIKQADIDFSTFNKIATRSYQATSTGTKTITGLGFRPRKVTVISKQGIGSSMQTGMGMALNTIDGVKQFVKADGLYTSGTATEANGRFDETIFMGNVNSPAGNGFRTQASLTSFDADGITFNVIARTATFDSFYLIFEG